MSNEPTYKITLIDNKPGLVVQGDDVKTISQAIADVLPVYERFVKRMGTPPTTNQKPQQGGENPMCKVHGVAMVLREGVSKKTNKPYSFYACPQLNIDGSYCNYRP